MDKDAIEDLKQFIKVTISQQLNQAVSELRSEIKALDNKLSTKIDDLSASVAEALDNSNEVNHGQLQDHEKRITKLEHKAI